MNSFINYERRDKWSVIEKKEDIESNTLPLINTKVHRLYDYCMDHYHSDVKSETSPMSMIKKGKNTHN